jgi:hypothetical protein
MIVSPKWGTWISIVAAIISVLVLCGAEFTTLFGALATNKILAALGIANAVINGINGVLHMIPASAPTTVAGANQFPLGPAKT